MDKKKLETYMKDYVEQFPKIRDIFIEILYKYKDSGLDSERLKSMVEEEYQEEKRMHARYS